MSCFHLITFGGIYRHFLSPLFRFTALILITICKKGLTFYNGLSLQTLYTDAIGYFPEKLVELMDIMTEKELRIRAPIEELDILMETSE